MHHLHSMDGDLLSKQKRCGEQQLRLEGFQGQVSCMAHPANPKKLYHYLTLSCSTSSAMSFSGLKFSHLMWPKEDVPNLVTYLNRTSIFEWYVIRYGSKNGHQKDVSKREWTMCSRNDNHSSLNRQHSWRDLYGHLISTRIFTLRVTKIFMWASKIMREVAIASIWIC